MEKEHLPFVIIAGLAALVYSYSAPILSALELWGNMAWFIITLSIPLGFCLVVGAIGFKFWEAVTEVSHRRGLELMTADTKYFEAQKKTPLVAGQRRQLSTPSTKALPAPVEVPVMYGEWWHDTIAVLKSDVERYDQAIKTRIVGNDGAGKSVFVNHWVNDLISPFPTAETIVLDSEGDNDKWGVDILAKSIGGYDGALRHIITEMENAETTTDNPKIIIVDETDTYYQNDKSGSIENINNLQKRGRKRAYWPVIIGQSALVKESGISTSVNKLFNVTLYLGVSVIRDFLKRDEYWQDKQSWLDTLGEIAKRDGNHNRQYVGLCTFPNDPTIAEPFLFVLPHLKREPLKPTTLDVPAIRRSILEGVVADEIDERTATHLAILADNPPEKNTVKAVLEAVGLTDGGGNHDHGKKLYRLYNKA